MEEGGRRKEERGRGKSLEEGGKGKRKRTSICIMNERHGVTG